MGWWARLIGKETVGKETVGKETGSEKKHEHEWLIVSEKPAQWTIVHWDVVEESFGLFSGHVRRERREEPIKGKIRLVVCNCSKDEFSYTTHAAARGEVKRSSTQDKDFSTFWGTTERAERLCEAFLRKLDNKKSGKRFLARARRSVIGPL